MFSAGKCVVSTILMSQSFCYESDPLASSPRYQYSKQVCGGLFMCGDISKCQGLNSSRLCSEMLLMVAVPGRVTQPGLKDRSSMARTSEASLSAESRPRIATWETQKMFKKSFSRLFYYISAQSAWLCVFWPLSICM